MKLEFKDKYFILDGELVGIPFLHDKNYKIRMEILEKIKAEIDRLNEVEEKYKWTVHPEAGH